MIAYYFGFMSFSGASLNVTPKQDSPDGTVPQKVDLISQGNDTYDGTGSKGCIFPSIINVVSLENSEYFEGLSRLVVP